MQNIRFSLTKHGSIDHMLRILSIYQSEENGLIVVIKHSLLNPDWGMAIISALRPIEIGASVNIETDVPTKYYVIGTLPSTEANVPYDVITTENEIPTSETAFCLYKNDYTLAIEIDEANRIAQKISDGKMKEAQQDIIKPRLNKLFQDMLLEVNPPSQRLTL